jgi:hypothetical protein
VGMDTSYESKIVGLSITTEQTEQPRVSRRREYLTGRSFGRRLHSTVVIQMQRGGSCSSVPDTRYTTSIALTCVRF